MQTKIVDIVLDNRPCAVYVVNGDNGAFYRPSSNDPATSIHIGIDSEWDEVFDTLLHELFEGICGLMHATYMKEDYTASLSANSLFVMDHNQFSEIIHRTSSAALQIIGPLAAKYKQYHKKKGKKSDQKSKQ